MSFAIPTVAPLTVTNTTVAPVAGSTTTLNEATPIVITDPNATTTPAVVTGSGTMALGTQGAQVVLEGSGTINVGIARDANGNPLGMGGAVIQANDTSDGNKVVNLDGANVGGAKVSGDVDLGALGGAGTIADNAPPGTFSGAPDTYVHTGAGSDEIKGSAGIDFIRGGAGSDTIHAGAGDDIVRPGAGNDFITLGQGNDVVYLTVDQLQGESTNTISDFKENGADKIQISGDLSGLVSISGQGTNQIVISLSGAQTGTTTIVSQGQTINDDDIEFV